MNPTSHFSDHSASPPPSPPRSPAPAPGPSYEDDLEWLFAQVAEQNLQMAKEDANSTSYEITDSVTGLSSGIKLAMRGNRRVKITDAANFKGKAKASRDSKKKAKTTPGLDDDEIKPDLARRARSHSPPINLQRAASPFRPANCLNCGHTYATHLLVDDKLRCSIFNEINFGDNAFASGSGRPSVASPSSTGSSLFVDCTERMF